MAALVFLLAAALAGELSAASKMRTLEALRKAHASVAPRAFVKGDNVRFFYLTTNGPVHFTADWKKVPLEGLEFGYRTATLKLDILPHSVPSAGSSWREATVLSEQEWSRLAQQTAENLTPREPDRGCCFRVGDKEWILYRDAAGKIKSGRLQDKPPAVQLVRSLNAPEFAREVTAHFQDYLRTVRSGQSLFLVTDDLGNGMVSFLLFDLAKRRCVYLFPPELLPDPPGLPFMPGSTFWSLIVESHGFALLKNPVSSAGRLLNLGLHAVAAVLPSGRSRAPATIPPLADRPGMDLAAWEKRLDQLTGTHCDYGTMKFLINGEHFFPRLEQRIDEATNYVHLRIHIFDNDDIAVQFADRLRRRSRDVDVRVIIDRLNSSGAAKSPPATPMPEGFVSPQSIGTYLERGSKVKVRPFLNPWLTSDHAKILTLDGRVAYVGGMNIGREYRSEWHDLMIEMEGPIVAHFERDFRNAWAHASVLGDLAYAAANLCGPMPRPPREIQPGWARIRRLYTRTTNKQFRDAVIESIRSARSYIYFQNCYLYANPIIDELGLARRRGVDVRVIFPSETDFGPTDSINLVTANRLLANGVRVFIYPGMTHVKALLVDGWACLGSANFNKLSLERNQEANVATSDPEIVGHLKRELFEEDFAKCVERTEPVKVSWSDRLAEQILHEF